MTTKPPPVSTEVKVPCLACGRECPDGLRYCLYCGGKTMEIDKPVIPMDPHCPKCGEDDELSIIFCVLCGSKLATPAAPGLSGSSASPTASGNFAALSSKATTARFSRKTGFNWTVEVTPPPAVKMAMTEFTPRPAVVAAPVLKSRGGLIPIAIGAGSGLLVALLIAASGLTSYGMGYLTWPKSGLVVYCPEDVKEPSRPRAIQFSLENLGTHTFTVASVTPRFAPSLGVIPNPFPRASCLVLNNLPKGDYMMRMERSGGGMVSFAQVKVEDGRPTVIGYPNGISLPN